jgi:Fe-S-cluster containining protein
MDAEKIAENARRSISRFCIEECRSYCCRKGYLVVLKKQLSRLMGGREALYMEVLKPISGESYSLFLGRPDRPCPSLGTDFRCTIHKSRLRPQACRQFPLFIRGNVVLTSPRCLAVRLGMLYPYLAQLRNLGYRIRRNRDFDNLEFVTVMDVSNHSGPNCQQTRPL